MPLKLLCYMATPGGLTGAPRRLLTLCKALQQHGIVPVIISDPQSDLIQEAKRNGIATDALAPQGVLALRHGALFGGGVLFRLRVLLALLVQNIKFLFIVRRQKADVVWVRGSKGIGFIGMGAWLSRAPIVWDVDYEPPSGGVVRLLHRLGLCISKRVVFQYSAAADGIFGKALSDKYRSKFQTLIPGIDLLSVQYPSVNPKNPEEKHNAAFTLLQVGTICDRKNQALLVEALRFVIPECRGRQVLVRFAGGTHDSEYYAKLKENIASAGLERNFEFLGWRDDVQFLAASADLVVLPSKDEGVPNAIQEAMALGTPVIVAKSGGMPEIVKHGETGWVLPFDDPEAWIRQIFQCYESPEFCRNVGKNASIFAQSNFSTVLWAERYSKIIKQFF